MSPTTKRKPKALGSSLSALLKSLGIDAKVKQHEVILRWPEIVGEKLSGIAQADKVENGILFVNVSNSAWRNELIYMKKEFLERIRANLRTDLVRDIRFT